MRRPTISPVSYTHLDVYKRQPKERAKGLGRQLIQYGKEHYSLQTLAVNEQNPLAIGFYEHMGFQVYRRTERDEQGNPYPLLYMKLM